MPYFARVFGVENGTAGGDDGGQRRRRRLFILLEAFSGENY